MWHTFPLGFSIVRQSILRALCRSLLPGSAPLSTSDYVEALLDVLAGARGVALQAAQVQQTCALIFLNLCLDALATETAYVLLHIFLVQTVDHRALVTSLQKDVSLTAKVAFDIHLGLEEVEYVGFVAIQLLTQHVEVHDRCLCRHELGLWKLTTLVFGLLGQLARLFVHDGLDAVEHELVGVVGVSLNFPVKHL